MPAFRNVFISHHHADDKAVSSLVDMVGRNGNNFRNSSIRAKPANQRRLEQGLVSDNTIKRLIRMKMSWSSTVIVLIGKNTASRPWVDWEIDLAHRLGKRIIGVYEWGGTENQKPTNLEQYASAIVNWNAKSLVSAVEGENIFQTPAGEDRQPVHVSATSRC
jgi:MTH538 TIR-like domain (DUF1863)